MTRQWYGWWHYLTTGWRPGGIIIVGTFAAILIGLIAKGPR